MPTILQVRSTKGFDIDEGRDGTVRVYLVADDGSRDATPFTVFYDPDDAAVIMDLVAEIQRLRERG